MQPHQDHPHKKRTKKDTAVAKDVEAKRGSFKAVFKEKYKSFDQFGQNVTFTYNGEDTFKTMFGATMSYIIIVIVLYFAYKKIDILAHRLNPTVMSTSFSRDLDAEDPYRPQDIGFSLGFGVQGGFDSSIGYY